MNKRMTLVAAALLGLAATTQVSAQTCSTAPSCSVNNTASVTVPTLMQLTLSSTTTALTVPAVANFDGAAVADNGPTATVKANKGWNLTIASSANVWTAAGGANAAKASTDLAWSTAANGTFAGLSTTPATVLTSGTGSSTSQSIFYQTSWHSAGDTPGTYSLTVVYTLNAP
ncbi:MAG TPA: hypothetical protein VMH88_14030 [Gemmatimonadales bacterium]|nr:hypothetical protein [Gemmatimonadales bacterium]